MNAAYTIREQDSNIDSPRLGQVRVKTSIIVGHPFGNSNVREAIRALAEADALGRFVTTICAEHVPFRPILPKGIAEQLDRRSYSGIDARLIESHPWRECARLLGNQFPAVRSSFPSQFPSIDDMWRALDKALQRAASSMGGSLSAVYAYEDGAYQTFSSVHGLEKLYELPIGHWRSLWAILEEERDLKPEWASTLTGLSDSEEKKNRKDAELALASRILVPSDFVRSTLPKEFLGKTAVVPYGCQPSSVTPNIGLRRTNNRLKVLFCGSLGQRKGIAYFFEAIGRLQGHVDVTVVGSKGAGCPALSKALAKVNWIGTMPRTALLDLMRSQDVLVLPTLFEGRALVVTEALSQGVPVITTTNSGTADLIVERESGFVVPIRSSEAIVRALEELIENQELLLHMKERALAMAASYSWGAYRKKLRDTLEIC